MFFLNPRIQYKDQNPLCVSVLESAVWNTGQTLKSLEGEFPPVIIITSLNKEDKHEVFD